ncbi:TetR family transcriptional regulator [Halospina denitrificans]|uniref:TetR family transcriptional regulator n=1 Tax=Halospina denitrificans TaxID=332522 RepID=A0A4R7JQB1_9GAMM|nr:TetR/AcrR family transcriptional regulator [Halospina denitrificans]TDT40320.1 TetR family transcriptional regulator [Halospina denitrificans]
MAYRETPRMRARKEATRQRILDTTHALVAEGGFGLASVARVAENAGVAIGSVYRHFDSKSDLFAEVFRRATEQEVHKVGEALDTAAPADEALAESLGVFARRAIRSPTMAWALIAEPVDPLVDEERLRYRQAYAELFQQNLTLGIEQGHYRPDQNPQLGSAAIVGAIAEALVGPLSPAAGGLDSDSADRLINDIVRFCMQAVRTGE